MSVTVTDSAGTTCRYTPVEDLKPGDVVIIGWRSEVEAVSVSYGRGEARVFWRGVPGPDQWNPLGTALPVEVCDG